MRKPLFGVCSSALILALPCIMAPFAAGQLFEAQVIGPGGMQCPYLGPGQEEIVVLVTLGSTVLSPQPLEHHRAAWTGVQT